MSSSPNARQKAMQAHASKKFQPIPSQPAVPTAYDSPNPSLNPTRRSLSIDWHTIRALQDHPDQLPPCNNPAISPDTLKRIMGIHAPIRRLVLLALLHGHSPQQAAAAAGVSINAITKWLHDSPSFNSSFHEAKDLGFATILELELYNRALNGPDDRSSMRALELVVKQRDHSYRDAPKTINLNLPVPESIRAFSPEALGLNPDVIENPQYELLSPPNEDPPQ